VKISARLARSNPVLQQLRQPPGGGGRAERHPRTVESE